MDDITEFGLASAELKQLRQKFIAVAYAGDAKMLQRLITLAGDLEAGAEQQGEAKVASVMQRLRTHTAVCLASGKALAHSEKMRLGTLFDQALFALAEVTGSNVESVTGLKSLPISDSIFLVGGHDVDKLAAKLEHDGLRVRRFADIKLAAEVLENTLPQALLMQTDAPNQVGAGIQVVESLGQRVALTIPIFFLSQRDDLATRMLAIGAGGAGFFTYPLDSNGLSEKLQGLLFQQTQQTLGQVLVVTEEAEAAEQTMQALVASGIEVMTISDPLTVIDTLQHFHPQALVIDLSLTALYGLGLARVLRQHQDCYALPMILLCEADQLEASIDDLSDVGDDLLIKPVSAAYLAWVLRRRLQRSQAVSNKLGDLRYTEPVSGLYNRNYYLNQLETAMHRRQDEPGQIAVMIIMLDNLRKIRDSLDLVSADEVVMMAAKRLQNRLGEQYLLARLSDVSFALLGNGLNRAELEQLAKRAHRLLEQEPYEIGDHQAQLRICIGVSLSTPDNDDHLSLIQHADLACTLARDDSVKATRFYDPAEVADADATLYEERLIERVTEAVKQGRARLVFQPVVSLLGSVERYEAFLRLWDEEGHELLPETVFHAAQNHRLGIYLDRWVIIQALHLLRREDKTNTSLFINICPASLRDQTMSSWLQEQLTKAQIDPVKLVFEVNEDTVRRHQKAYGEFLENAQRLGFGSSIERFGRQADSLELLRAFPSNYVKLDSQFAANLSGRDKTSALTDLKDLVKNISVQETTPIATGIEDLHVLPNLFSSGIAHVQGYVLQRPDAEMNFNFSGEI